MGLSNYPTGLDAITNRTDNVDDVLAAHINLCNDAIEAIEAKLGIDSSAVVTSIEYLLKNASSVNPGHTHTDLQETSVADEAEITLDTSKAGRCWAMAGDNEEYINVQFNAAGVVTIINNSPNAINTDTDGFLCVYDAGTGIRIKNRLGSAKVIRYLPNYS